VFAALPSWKVCVGSPARPVKDRVLSAGTKQMNVKVIR
jgi:acetyltransferase-like isoleucine patch superfamily enzyme